METVWFCLFLAALLSNVVLLVWNMRLDEELQTHQDIASMWAEETKNRIYEIDRLERQLSRVGVVRNAKGQMESVK